MYQKRKKRMTKTSTKPKLILAKTIKGKGLSFMENNAAWHHGGIDEEKFLIAQKELTT